MSKDYLSAKERMQRRESILAKLMNFVAIFSYCVVAVCLFGIGTVGVMWASGSFNVNTEKVAGLKFDVNSITISENGGNAKFTVLSAQGSISYETKTEVVTDEHGHQTEVERIVKVVNDPTERVDIRIEVWDDQGNKVQTSNAIVSVANKTTLCEETTITAILDEDDFNIGGVCYLHAYTTDDIYFANPIPIYVDVPIDSVQLKARDLNNKDAFAVEKDTTKENALKIKDNPFIKGDAFELYIETIPSRALNPYGNSKIASYSSARSVNEIVVTGLSDNLAKVNITATNNFAGDASLYVGIPRTCSNSEDIVECELIVKIEEISVKELQIKNVDVTADDYNIDVTLFGNATNISALNIENSQVTSTTRADVNLDLFLQPEHYNVSTNTNPLRDKIMSSYVRMAYSTSNVSDGIDDGIPALFTISPTDLTDGQGNPNILWSITTNRDTLDGEEVMLIIYYSSEEQTIADIKNTDKGIKHVGIPIKVSAVLPENAGFTQSSLNLEIEKTLTIATKEGTTDKEESEIISGSDNIWIYDNSTYNYTPGANENPNPLFNADFDAQKHYSYSKFVFFITPYSGTKAEDSNGTKIVNMTENGMLVNNINDTNYYNLILQPNSYGSVIVTPYLIRTDKNGNPVDRDYKIIETSEDEIKGVVTVTGTISLEEVNKYYVCIQQYPSLTVNVKEKLTGFTLYKNMSSVEGDTDTQILDDKDIIDEHTRYLIGIGANNKATIYARANSYFALYDESFNDFESMSFVNNENSKNSYTISNSNLDVSIIATYIDNCRVKHMFDDTSTTNYTRILKLEITVTNNTSIMAKNDNASINVVMSLGDNSCSFGLSTKTIEINRVAIVSSDDSNYVSLIKDEGDYGTTTLYSDLEDDSTHNGYKVKWTSDLSNKEKNKLLNASVSAETISDSDLPDWIYSSGSVLKPTYSDFVRELYYIVKSELNGDDIQDINTSGATKNGNDLICDIRTSQLTLYNASNYASIYTDTNGSGSQIQFKTAYKDFGDDKTLILVYRCTNAYENIFNDDAITQFDFAIISATLPATIDKGSYTISSGVSNGGNICSKNDFTCESSNIIASNSAITITSGSEYIEYSDGNIKLKSGYVIASSAQSGYTQITSSFSLSVKIKVKYILQLTDGANDAYELDCSCSISLGGDYKLYSVSSS